MNGTGHWTGKLPGRARSIVVATLFFSAAALLAEDQPAKKGSNPPARGQVTHGPQASGHGAASTAGHRPGSTEGTHGYAGGGTGNQHYQTGHPGARPTGGIENRPYGGRPGYSQGRPGAGYGGAHGAPGRMVMRSPDTTVYRAPGGERRIVHTLPGGRIAVANGRGHGYVQRSVNIRGRAFVQRTYYEGGRPQARFYRPYLYNGVSFNVYAPPRFYSPRFYAWAYRPWAAPVSYDWGWGSSPWYGYYGGYFAPSRSYTSPNLWLTDYVLAASLQEAYQERMDAAADASSAEPAPAAEAGAQPILTPEVKQIIADEIRQQLALESSESQTARAPQTAPPSAEPVASAPPALSPNTQHVFIVSSVVVVNADGQQCAITQGDVIQLDPADPYPDPTNAKVLSSKTADCQSGKAVQIGLEDLQEMQNHMREMLDKGLGELQAKQGQGNLPVLEASLRTQTPAPYAAELPAPDPDVASELQRTAQANAAASAPVTVSLGQSIDAVIAAMGQPNRKIEGPMKTIYFYSDLKITFTRGEVSDVE